MKRLAWLVPVVALVMSGCGRRDGVGFDDGRPSGLSAGGRAGYCQAPVFFVPLSGATVTLTGFDTDDVHTASSADGGAWELEDVPEGTYTFAVSMTGYEPISYPVVLSQSEALPSAFVDLGTVCLYEAFAVATIEPMGAAVENRSNPTDGVDGTFVYSPATDGDIVVTLDRPFVVGSPSDALPILSDGATGASIAAENPGGPQHTFVFTEAAIDALNSGGGLSAGPSLHQLSIYVPTYDPINGGLMIYDAKLDFRVAP